MTYAFSIDASTCTGCKACQVACKDKNDLPAGVLLRRVFEVSGGGWERQGSAWTNTVFAYNLSVACNHCVHPKCAGVCPTNAFTQRQDGIVLLDASKCMGCGYCAWACPYSAPQLDPTRGTMAKCDLCQDQLEAGLPPVCVAACPLRSLELVQVEAEPSIDQTRLWELPGAEHPFPLPNFSRTEPHLQVKPHTGMQNSLEKRVANREEVDLTGRKTSSAKSELPLLLFTLCGQAAAGLAVWQLFFKPTLVSLLLTGLLLGLGGLFSFLHLGRKRNAWRAISHLQKSWLSREVLFSGLFGAAWLVTLGENLLLGSHFSLFLTTLVGIMMVASMGNIYRLRAVPAWNTWRTNTSFFLSALVLGLAALTWQNGHSLGPALLALLIGIQLELQRERRWWKNLVAALAVVALFLWLASGPLQAWMLGTLILLALVEEVWGRWEFYASRKPAM